MQNTLIPSLLTVLVFTVSTNAAFTVELKNESPHTAKPSVLHASIARSELSDNLDMVGIKCQLSTNGQQYPIVTSVIVASPAYYGGIIAKDQIVSFQKIDAGFKITITREGKSYQIVLKPQYAQMSVTGNLQGGIDRSLLKGATSQSAHPFLPSTIAKDDVNGVEQSPNYPDCWFEACLAALAHTPRGQKLISNMIVQDSKSSYLVNFPGDHASTPILIDHSFNSALANNSLWASLIETACLKSYNANEIAHALRFTPSRPAIQIGMELLMGVPAQAIRADTCTASRLAQILNWADKNRVPLTMSTKGSQEIQGSLLLTGNHAYTLVAFDPVTNEATLRNAYGSEPYNAQAELAGVHYLREGLVKVPVHAMLKYIRFISYPLTSNSKN